MLYVPVVVWPEVTVVLSWQKSQKSPRKELLVVPFKVGVKEGVTLSCKSATIKKAVAFEPAPHAVKPVTVLLKSPPLLMVYSPSSMIREPWYAAEMSL